MNIGDIRKAAAATLALARAFGMGQDNENTLHPAMTYNHLAGMLERMQAPDFGIGKANRWLGYMQGVVLARGNSRILLDDIKTINRPLKLSDPKPASLDEARDLVTMWSNFHRDDRALVAEGPECDAERDSVLALLDELESYRAMQAEYARRIDEITNRLPENVVHLYDAKARESGKDKGICQACGADLYQIPGVKFESSRELFEAGKYRRCTDK